MDKKFHFTNATSMTNFKHLQKKLFNLDDLSLLFNLKKNSENLYDLNLSLQQNSFKKLNLLIIDDDAFIVDILSQILQLRGHCVYTADTINRGLAIYQHMSEKIDLVILNLFLSNNVDYRLTIPGLLSINNQIKIIGINKNISGQTIPSYFKDILFGFLDSPFIIRDLLKTINSFNKPFIVSNN